MRFKKRIDLNELKSEYQPNTYISFNLPKGKLDLYSLSLFYTGNPAIFKNITNTLTYTKYFNGSAAATHSTGVALATDTIKLPRHGFVTGDSVKYDTDGGDPVEGLLDNGVYFVIKNDDNSFRLATTLANATANIPITFLSRGTGTNHSFSIFNDTFYRTIKRFFPRLSSSIISELTVKINNEVKQHIQEYSMINAILNDIYKEYDDIDSDSFDTVQEHSLSATTGFIDNTSKISSTLRASTFSNKYSDENKRKFYINKFLGFLNEGNRYFDTTDKDVQIVIKLAPPSILYRGMNLNGETYTTNSEFSPDYVLSDIYATIDVLDDIPPPPSEFVFNDYRYIEGTYLDNDKKSLTSFQIDKPVQWVLGTFSNPNRNDDSELQMSHCNSDNVPKFGSVLKDFVDLPDINNKVPNNVIYSYEVGKFQKDPYLLNSSIYFDRQGRGIRFCKYRLNNYDLTPMLDVIACYSETKKCFDSPYKKVISLASFEENFFANAVRLDDYTEELKKIDWEVEIDLSKSNKNVGGTPMLFCCFKNKL